MSRYFIGYHGGQKPDSQEEGAALMAKWKAWAEGLGEALTEPGNPMGMSMTLSADGVSEGGGANPLCGYSVLVADSMDHALELTKTCPHLEIGTLEIAEMMEMNG